LKHHAVSSFDLAVAPGAGGRGVVDVDSIVLAKVLEDRASESCTQVSDDPIAHTKVMLDVSDEFLLPMLLSQQVGLQSTW
jgi:hypothetical protein